MGWLPLHKNVNPAAVDHDDDDDDDDDGNGDV